MDFLKVPVNQSFSLYNTEFDQQTFSQSKKDLYFYTNHQCSNDMKNHGQPWWNFGQPWCIFSGKVGEPLAWVQYVGPNQSIFRIWSLDPLFFRKMYLVNGLLCNKQTHHMKEQSGRAVIYLMNNASTCILLNIFRKHE